MKKTKSLNSIVNFIQDKGMKLTNNELKILYKINEIKTGITLTDLSNRLNIDLGNLSRYINALIAKGVVKDIGNNPRLLIISKPRELLNVFMVKCPNKKCNTIKVISNNHNQYRCKKCKRLVPINAITIISELKEESFRKLTSLCMKYQLESYDKLIDRLYHDTM